MIWANGYGSHTLKICSGRGAEWDMAKTTRIELRTDPEQATLLKEAARLTDQSLTAILDAAPRRAEEGVTQANTTVVPSDFFDAIDEPVTASGALKRAARRLDQLIEQ